MPDFNPGETLFCGLELLSGLLENSQAAAGQELGESGGGTTRNIVGLGKTGYFAIFPGFSSCSVPRLSLVTNWWQSALKFCGQKRRGDDSGTIKKGLSPPGKAHEIWK
jgi:hypothetical protein